MSLSDDGPSLVTCKLYLYFSLLYVLGLCEIRSCLKIDSINLPTTSIFSTDLLHIFIASEHTTVFSMVMAAQMGGGAKMKPTLTVPLFDQDQKGVAHVIYSPNDIIGEKFQCL
ncbi:Hypothetical predicted protein [Paramuricea clavata]|uniref:Uncharacterized protein n=1 Tax=Paramuricea clavata TaxID=317549 RepID=A0A6S7GS67_PARCT|nr:Hypothetical predicted protein [Paramuricea clavata]